MRISYNWLKEFVDFTQSPAEIAHLLTFIGLETKVLESSGGWKQVITAKVLEVQKHPNADKLRICSVTDGSRTYAIVCGAPNVAAGQTVPLALIGAELPGDFKIKKAKIRGVESEGMICSEKELGLSAESQGIMVLPDGTPLGRPLEEVTGESDSILEMEITTNRPDCLSHWGVAREIGARLGLPVKLPVIPTPKTADTVPITVEDYDLCPKYTGAVMTGVNVAPSPEWIARRLEKCGLRPINNIVDITNYVLLELGHPLHAFDRAKLDGGRIVVRRAVADEKILALDGRQYPLTDQMLVIADAVRPEAIAGVMGGESSGVTGTTKEIIVESALFAPVSIRRTSKALAISTDASYRFERGTGWQVADLASYRAIDLIEKVAGGTLVARSDKHEKDFVPVEITLRPPRVQQVLNVDVKVEDMVRMLRALGITVEEKDGQLVTRIPSWRLDLKQEIDLVEEIARLNGYENIPVTVLPISPDITVEKDVAPVEDILRGRLAGLGFCEAINYSFAEEASLKRFKQEAVWRIANPLSKENEVLRPGLLSGLWRNLTLNIGQGYDAIRLFEAGTVFGKEERASFALMVYGPVWSDWWGWEQRKVAAPRYDFYFLNGIVQHLFAGNRIAVKENKDCAPYYHPGKTAALSLNGKAVGQFGILRPEYTADLASEVGYAEFDVELIERLWNRKAATYETLRRFPPVKRDFSLLADKSVSFGAVTALLDTFITGDSLFREYDLFSRYDDEAKLGAGKISYSLHLVFRHPEHTLTDADVNGQIEQILARLKQDLNVTLR
jgi:phenylalanyl-tRNA synthetase beta chain